MKVIWRSKNSIEVGSKNAICASNSSRYILGKSKGHHALSQEHTQNKNDSSDEERFDEPCKESGDSVKPACRVCGRTNDLQDLETCNHLLQNCFGVKVLDVSAKVCRHCAELMLHTKKFKDMVCAAFRPASQYSASTLKNADSITSIANKDGFISRSSEENFAKKKPLKRKAKPETARPAPKKIIAVCSICKQKYPMPNATSDFVCSRCKISNAQERVVTCVKCRAMVSSTLIKEHLAIHAKANLKGRCRLRSLTEKPSKNEVTDCVSRKNNQLEPKCTRKVQHKFSEVDFKQHLCNVCGKDVVSANFLRTHMKTHEIVKTFECRFCGRIFKCDDALQRHQSLRHLEILL